MKKRYSATAPMCRVTFTLPIEAVKGGREVRLVGEFNAWQWEQGQPLQAGPTEYSTEVDLPTGRDYQFRFLIDNRFWANHWAADSYLPTPFGVDNSVVSLREVAITPPAHAVPRIVKKASAQGARTVSAADDLTKIEGIGPKIAELLRTSGIVTFADLAAAKPEALSGILKAGGRRYQIHDPTTWPEQARLATRGN